MKITIPALTLAVSLGVHSWEKTAPRDVTLRLEMEYDASQAALSDNVQDALDYAELENSIEQQAKSRHFDLLESLVDSIAAQLMKDYDVLFAITVEAEKKGALRLAPSVLVSCSRRR